VPDTDGGLLLLAHVQTVDGARIAIKRKPVKRGVPVIFLHGLAANADLWDLPEVHSEQYHYQSLASVLHAAGYDIWLVNLRGHGAPRMLSEPPADQGDWCVDHFILYDLPAVVDHVRRVTGYRPFVIGASMGSMTLAGYLQGTQLVEDGEGTRIVADADEARRRQANLAACVFAEFPASLRWPDGLYDVDGKLDWVAFVRDWWRTDASANYPFEILSRWGWLHTILDAMGEVPLGRVDPEEEGEPWYRKLPAPLAEGIEKFERSAVQAMLQIAGTFTGATNHRAEVMIHGRRYALDAMKSGVLRQMAKCVRSRAFVSEVGTPDHVYSNHYEMVELPTLVVQGGRDRIANPDVTRERFFDRIASEDKSWLFLEEIAHGEIEAAPIACERLYPKIRAWINAHRERARV